MTPAGWTPIRTRSTPIPMPDAPSSRLRRGLRVVVEIALLVVGFTVVGVVLKGLTPLAPVLAGVLRALFHPLTIAVVALLFLLLRAGRERRSTSSSGGRRGRSGEPPL